MIIDEHYGILDYDLAGKKLSIFAKNYQDQNNHEKLALIQGHDTAMTTLSTENLTKTPNSSSFHSAPGLSTGISSQSKSEAKFKTTTTSKLSPFEGKNNNKTGDSHLDSTSPPSSSKDTDKSKGDKHKNPHVVRGDEKKLDAKVKDEHTFAKLVDKVAKNYHLDPKMFRAQLEAESGAFNGPQAYLSSMHFVGDKDRLPQHNESLGLGQISRYFLDSGPWSAGEKVPSAQYNSSITTQLRMAAFNDRRHLDENGGDVNKALAAYVNGTPDTSNPKAAQYIANIEKLEKDSKVQDV